MRTINYGSIHTTHAKRAVYRTMPKSAILDTILSSLLFRHNNFKLPNQHTLRNYARHILVSSGHVMVFAAM